MAYKNTDGSSSISNEWGQWRYFNSAVEKLGAVKPAQVNINMPKLEVPEGNDWIGAIGGAINAGSKIWEARKTYSNKKAEEYFKTHSLEQYQSDMKAGNVPFQDDFLAMDALKTIHGNMLMQTVTADFMDSVNKNEFEGLTPEELDQKFYEFANENLKGASEDFGYGANDTAFTNGFFADAPEKRLKAMLQQKVVESSEKTNKALSAYVAGFTALVRGGADAKTVQDYILNGNSTFGAHFKTEHWDKFFTAGLSVLENSPKGYEIIQALKDMEIPNGGGVTLGAYMGEDKVEASFIRGKNKTYERDTQQRFDFENGCDELARNGNVTALNQMLTSLLVDSNNMETDQVKYVQASIKKAYNAQAKEKERAISDSNATKTKLQKAETSNFYIDRAFEGMPNTNPKTLGISSTDVQREYDIRVAKGTVTEADKLRYASNQYIPFEFNPPRKLFRDELTNTLDNVAGWADLIDTNQLNKLPKNNSELPPYFNHVVDLYRTYPESFRVMTDAKEFEVDQIKTIVALTDMGKPIEYIARSKHYTERDEKGARELHEKSLETAKILNELSPVKTIESIDQYGKEKIYGVATALMGYDKNLKPEAALTKAREIFKESHYSFLGGSYPKELFQDVNEVQDPIDPSKTVKVVEDYSKEFQELVKSWFDPTSKDFAMSKFEKDYRVSYHRDPNDPRKNAIIVTNTAGKELMYFTHDVIVHSGRYIQKLRERENNRIKAIENKYQSSAIGNLNRMKPEYSGD